MDLIICVIAFMGDSGRTGGALFASLTRAVAVAAARCTGGLRSDREALCDARQDRGGRRGTGRGAGVGPARRLPAPARGAGRASPERDHGHDARGRRGARRGCHRAGGRACPHAGAAWPSVTGHWLRGDTDSRFTAWFADGELRYLEEVALRRGAPPLRGRYYFEHGALFYYSGEEPARATVGGGATGIAASVSVLAEFEGAQARRAVRVEHYGEVLLDAAAVTELRRHAAILAGVARDEWSATGRR
jgi:hypothetical protein